MRTFTFLHRRLGVAAGFCLAWVSLVLMPAGPAQTLRIKDLVRTNGTVILGFSAETNRYYVLLRGNRLGQAFQAQDAVLGTAGTGFLRDRSSSPDLSFYRVLAVSLSQPQDTDRDGIDDVYELQTKGLNPLDPTDAAKPDPNAAGQTYLSSYRLAKSPPARVARTSPFNGESGVAVTRETVFEFDQPLAAGSVLGPTNLYATFGGRRILSRTELSSDRRKATLFYLENLPASARIRATLDGTGLTDALGKAFDANGDGVPGGSQVVDFDTLSTTPVGSTAVTGRVFASVRLPDGSDRPLKGVIITVDGAEEASRTVTDAEGFFRLQPAPAGRFFVHVDGRLAVGSSWPNGAYYPVVGKAWEAVAGLTNNLANGTGVIYLPLIPADALQPVSLTADTIIAFPPSAVAANPALAGVEIRVPANSLFDDNGQRGGRVGIAPVASDRLPEPLPAGIEHVLDITVQSDGPRNFDRPVPVRFPNLPSPTTGLKVPPGQKTALVSFNHDLGRWEVVGTMTASADGRFIDSDPGVGVRQPGWHGWQRLTWILFPPPPIYWPPNWFPPDPGPFPPPFPQPPNPPKSNPNPPWPPWPDFPDDPPNDWPDPGADPPPLPPLPPLDDWDWPPLGDDTGGGDTSGPTGPGGDPAGDPSGDPSGGGPGSGGSGGGGQASGAAAGFFCLTADIESGCTNSGPAVAAAATVAINPADGSSYTLGYSEFNGTVTAVVRSRTSGQIVFETQVQANRPANSVGFGPSQQVFAYHYRQPTGAGLAGDEVVLLATLSATQQTHALSRVITIPAATFNASSVSFSPHGRYMVYTGLRLNATITVVVVDVATREIVLNQSVPYSTTPVLVRPEDMVEFGPDCSDRTMILHFGDTPTSLGWYLYNLNTRTEVARRRLAPGSFSSWQFSPCGDAATVNAGAAVPREFLATLDGRTLTHLSSAGSPARAGAGIARPAATQTATRASVRARYSRGLHYWMLQDLLNGKVVKRGRTGASGVLLEGELLAPNRPFRLYVLRAADLALGRTEFVSGDVGTGFTPPAPILGADKSPDADGDGLTDFAELVVGSNRHLPDSNGDGVNDAAEVRGGLDPTAGSTFATGIVAATPLPGSAVDICAEGDRLVVALGTSGIAVVQHPPGQNPTVIGRVATAGDARRVACFGNFVAVASGPSGLQIVDVSDPPAARVAFFLPQVGTANCVVTADGNVYVGTESGQVVTVNLATGTELSRFSVGAPIQDLKLGGDRLYILSNRRLLPYRQDGGEWIAAGPGVTSGSGDAAGRLFIGGGFAYMTHGNGYRTFDLTNPDQPVERTTGNDTQIGWRQLAPNGSGLGLAAAGISQQAVEAQVYDVSDPALNTQFLTRYQLPAAAASVVIHRGVGYFAATTAGLQVLNYLDADIGTSAPVIRLATSFPLKPAQVESGRFVAVTALATDDVQVREVEFYRDGVRVLTDGSFPFEYAFYAPTLAADKTSFRLRAKAIDMAGNFAWSDEIVVSLLPDQTPPRARPTAPAANGFAVSPDRIGVLFNEPIASDSLRPDRLTLTFLGADRRLGTADDIAVVGTAVYQSASRLTELRFPTLTKPGRYQATLEPGVSDLSGNTITTRLVWAFEVVVGTDSDGDGLTDAFEMANGMDPKNADENNNGIPDSLEDFDGDGLTNGQEMLIGTNPRNQRTFNNILDTLYDQDGDYLTNIQELQLGTDPMNPDTDGDGWNDEIEVSAGSDPLVPNAYLPGLYGGLQTGNVLIWSGVSPGTGQGNVLRLAENTVMPGRNTANLLLQGGANRNGSSEHVARPVVRLREWDPQAGDLTPWELPRNGAFVIEAEDYNHGGGQHVAASDVMPYYGGTYANLSGVLDVDYHNTDGTESQAYRPLAAGRNVNLYDNVSGRYGLDRPTWTALVDYRIGGAAVGDWQQYTRNVPAGQYYVWAALSHPGTSPNQLTGSLEQVTGNAGQTDPARVVLGSFSGTGSGAWGYNSLILLRDALGEPAVVNAGGGATTLRFNLGSGDLDWFILVRTDAIP